MSESAARGRRRAARGARDVAVSGALGLNVSLVPCLSELFSKNLNKS
jgi:hypothetical protein